MIRRKKIEANLFEEVTVLVAGAAGLLGSQLVDSLLASGVKVIGVDDLSTGSRGNLAHLKGEPRFSFFPLDICEALPQNLFQEKITHIVHVANVEAYFSGEEVELNELITNSLGVKNLLDLALKKKANFLFTSTIELYQGIASSSSLRHYFDGVEVSGRFSYTEAKRFGEALCQKYATFYGLDVRVARLSGVYGPRMNLKTDSLLARLILKTLNKEDLIIEEDASQEHYLTYVSDVVYGLNKLLFASQESAGSGIFYFVNTERVSTLSIAYTLKEFIDFPVRVEFKPTGKESKLYTLPAVNLTRSRQELYWEPTVDLTQGLRLTLEYFREYGWGERKKIVDLGELEQVEVKAFEAPEEKETEETKEGVELEPETSKQPEQPESRAVLPTEEVELPASEREIPTLDEVGAGGAARPPAPPDRGEPARQVEVGPPAGETSPPPGKKGWLAEKRRRTPISLRGVEAKEGKGFLLKPSFWIGAFTFLLSFFFLLKPLFGVGYFGYQSLLNLSAVNTALGKSDFTSASLGLQKTRQDLTRTQGNLSALSWLFTSLQLRPLYQSGQNLLIAGYFSCQAGEASIDILKDLSPLQQQFSASAAKMIRQLGSTEEVESAEESDEAEIEEFKKGIMQAQFGVKLAKEKLSLAESTLNKVDLKIFPDRVRNEVSKIIEQIKILSWGHDLLEDWLPFFPQILGFEKPNTILVLLQNNNELRPTGGFIGSYALARFSKGGLVHFRVDDIYNPDGLLAEKIPAPEPIRNYMGVEFWGIRDSNWWIDFPKSAQQISDLFYKATSEEIDLVMGINLKVMEQVLEVLGPVYLQEYKEVVSAENLFEKAEFHSEVGFEPGSSQKKDFLGTLTQEVIKSILNLPTSSWLKLVKSFQESLRQKEIMLFAIEETMEQFLQKLSWDGRLKDSSGDFLTVVDTNVGGNKANFWVTRSTYYRVDVDRDGNLTGVLNLEWRHTGTSGTWPGGDYKNFLRVYVPQGVILLEESGFTDTPYTYDELGKTVLAGLVTVPVDSTHKIKLQYKLPTRVGLADSDSYSLLVQKQPGISEEAFSFTFNPPLFLKVTDISTGQVDSHSGQVRWETFLNQDKTFSLEVTR